MRQLLGCLLVFLTRIRTRGQRQITPLVDSDFLEYVWRPLRDTVHKQAPLPANLCSGRDLIDEEARLESAMGKAYVEKELRWLDMPATFTACLHFSPGSGCRAQFVALALIARDTPC